MTRLGSALLAAPVAVMAPLGTASGAAERLGPPARPTSPARAAFDAGRLEEYAACLVTRYPAPVTRFLQAPANAALHRRAADLDAPFCLPWSQLSLSALGLRGMLFAEALRRRDAAARGGPPWAMGHRPLDPEAPAPGGDAVATAHAARLRLADCVARADPAEAGALVVAPLASAARDAAAVALMPAVEACARRTGASAPAAMLEGALAEVLYREPAIAHAAAVAPAAPAN